MSMTTDVPLKAAGWCCCRERHEDERPCPGPLNQEADRASLFCTYCGSTYRADALECETSICNRCNGKRL
jgi:hypothetical protein